MRIIRPALPHCATGRWPNANFTRAMTVRKKNSERVLAARLERYGPDHPTTAESLWDLGFLYLRYAPASDPDRPRAADLIAQALDIHQRHLRSGTMP